MEIFYSAVFAGLLVLCGGLEFRKPADGIVIRNDDFLSFRNNYLLVYSLMMAGDWLQGPYVYALYEHYGYDVGQIGKLFIAGFGASLLFGTLVGSLADKYGRKRAALTYCACYIASCFTKHWSDYGVLMLGRVFGGVATSLLFSAFESWLVAEHFKRGYEEAWLGQTFSKAVFLGNGLVAILSGLLGNLLVEPLNLGPVAPFDAAALMLVIGGWLIVTYWVENFGEASGKRSLGKQISDAVEALQSDSKLGMLGAMQSLYEGSMYTFVFLWTPALSPNGEHIPHGFIFACFMLASMVGSATSGILMAKGYKPERYMQVVFAIAAAALSVPVWVHVLGDGGEKVEGQDVGGISQSGKLQMLAFLVFEVTVGVFWPSMMKMRAQYVPEHLRSTLINFFRIPLNIIVCIVLYNVKAFPLASMFGVCCFFLLITLFCQIKLEKATIEHYMPVSHKDVESEETQ